MYTYLLDRRSLFLLVGGASFAGVLLFVAGLLVGLRLNTPQMAEAREFQGLAAFDAGILATASAEPAAPSSVPAEGVSTPEASTDSPEPAAKPSSAKGEAAAGGAATVTADTTSAAPATVPEPASPPVVAAKRAPSAEPTATTEPVLRTPPAPTAGRFTVQVGAYGVAENAERQLAQVEAEGFVAEMVAIRTAGGRVLTSVQLSGYATREAASAAAARYLAAAPGRDAIVKPSG